jgi:hypothetical protein
LINLLARAIMIGQFQHTPATPPVPGPVPLSVVAATMPEMWLPCPADVGTLSYGPVGSRESTEHSESV